MYWEKAGPENTQKTVELALQRAGDLGIQHLIVASNEGKTAEHFIDKGLQIICVTHQAGFRNPGEVEMRGEIREKLQKAGMKVLTTTHFDGPGWTALYVTNLAAYILQKLLRIACGC